MRELLGVLTLEPNVSRGIVTTTTDFAPSIWHDPEIAKLTPYRLELKNREKLLERLNGGGHKIIHAPN